MRAAFYTRQGPASEVFQVGEQPTPEPGPGEVRVRLATSGVNPSDWKVRKGGFGRALSAPLIIPHSDGAGTIDAVGTGVPASRIGERVWIWNGQWKRPFGTAAEWIALPFEQAVRLPDTTGFDAGACLGIPVFTAMHAVLLADAKPGGTVLVSGGAGSVGHYAIQIAKARGARVLATVSSASKAAHARDAGADETIDYRTEDVGARVQALTGGRGVDAVIEMDLATNGAAYPKILAPRATVAVYGMAAAQATLPTLWMMQNFITLKFLFVYELTPAERQAALAAITDLLERNALRHTIALRLPLARIAEAHDAVEGGKVMGNVVLEIA
jgi:NADPH2:quinone reductase